MYGTHLYYISSPLTRQGDVLVVTCHFISLFIYLCLVFALEEIGYNWSGMTALLISLILNGIALFITATYVPGLHIRKGMEGFIDAVIGGAILAVVNAVIRPVLLILTLPINLLTLGLFTFVILGITFWLMTIFTPGIKADGLFPAILGALLFGLLNWLLRMFLVPSGNKP